MKRRTTATATTKTIACLAVAGLALAVGGGGARAQAGPPAPVPAGGAPVLVPPPAGVVLFRANRQKATLQEQRLLEWKDVCTTPCRVGFEADRPYRVGGRSFIASEPFTLRPGPTELLLEARVGKTNRRRAGYVLAFGSFVVAPAVALYCLHESARLKLSTCAPVGIIVGGALAAVGIPLWATSYTTVHVE